MTTVWDFEGYWNAVLGSGNATNVVREHELVGADGLDEWLGTAEAEAWAMGGGDALEIPEEWTGFHARALSDLTAAAVAAKAAGL